MMMTTMMMCGRIHDLTCMKELLKAEVHDSEIMCLEYAKPPSGVCVCVCERERESVCVSV